MERFFDESGRHATRDSRAVWQPRESRVGSGAEKRFCRTFNFELQAAATEDAIILSLTGSHSFVLDDVWRGAICIRTPRNTC